MDKAHQAETKSSILLNCDSCNKIHREYSELHAYLFGRPQRVSGSCLHLEEQFQNSRSPTSVPKSVRMG